MNSTLKIFTMLLGTTLALNLAMNYMGDNISDFESLPLPLKRTVVIKTNNPVLKVDAQSKERWTLVDFSSKKTFQISDPETDKEQMNRQDWDLGFQRTKIISNGGVTNPQGLAFDPNTATLYGTDTHLDQLLIIDTTAGIALHAGPLGFDFVGALAFDPNTNTLFGADASSASRLITINPATGNGSLVGPIGFSSIMGLAFDPNTDTLYGADRSSRQLIVIDPANGAGAPVGSLGLSPTGGLTFDPNTNTLYASEPIAGRLYVIDTETGAGTLIGSIRFDHVTGLAF
ncbi:MAG: hypothetical protein IIA63_08935, partial [Nitrospinae bacterium]|nr:hypothetical protein [Nitrospinota bacterium]